MQANRNTFRAYLDAFRHPGSDAFERAAQDFFAPDASINMVHPFNELVGSDLFIKRFVQPLSRSFQGLYRRDYISMVGNFQGGQWVSSTGYYVGNFIQDWLGIKATDRLAWLRVGEFHRMENGQAVESFIFLDLPELMIACGQWPNSISSPATVNGYQGYLPGPASQDGILMEASDPAVTGKSLKMVEEMLLGLATADEAWRPYWHNNMMWFGPAAFGSFCGVEHFRAFQVPFENCFSSWVGGSKPGSETHHFTRYADGNYVCSGGWPSLNAHQVKPFLGQPATNKTLYMRVCDWWRREGDLLVENWVFVDIPHVLLQMGHDVFADAGVQPS